MHYRLRNDLKIGNDSDSINSVFVEIDKSTAGTKHNIIVGCVYRPPWLDLSYFNELLNNVLDLIHGNHYVFLLGDLNVDLSHGIGTNLPIEEFKNIFLTHHLYPLINKPTREVKSSNTIIDNIFCNVPNAIETVSGQIPAGQIPPGQIPPGQIPAGQIPPGHIPTTQKSD